MRFGIIGNTDKPELGSVLHGLINYLAARQLPYVVVEPLGRWVAAHLPALSLAPSALCVESELPKCCDVVIALGGDGTMLIASRIVGRAAIPILGVNLGKLGFLAEVSTGEIDEAINDIVQGKYTIEERSVLRAVAEHDNATLIALNDIVVDKGASARMIELEVFVNNDYLGTYAADGLIIATPTGSTAYSLASGGPIITPGSNVLVLTPVSPHSLTSRPLIIPDKSIIRIKVHSPTRAVHIMADGQGESFYDAPAAFTIQRADYCIRLIKRKKRTYFDLLRAKLLWGKDIRQTDKG